MLKVFTEYLIIMYEKKLQEIRNLWYNILETKIYFIVLPFLGICNGNMLSKAYVNITIWYWVQVSLITVLTYGQLWRKLLNDEEN